MRNVWNFSTAGKIIFGNDAVQGLGKLMQSLSEKTALVVTDPGIKAAGILETALSSLKQEGVSYAVYDQCEPEPRVEKAVEAYDFAKNQNCGAIIGLGGGSSIDLAKAVAVLLTYGGSPKDYFGEFKVPGPVLPLVAIPTTSGTGTEVTPAAVLTDLQANLKIGISDNYIRPMIALVDPMLTVKMPPAVTASTGIDALTHAIEAYTAIGFEYLLAEGEALYQGTNDLTDALAEKAIKLVSDNLRLAVDQGQNVKARYNMALGSVLAGMAFSNAGVGAAHAIAYPVGAATHAPHGVLCGLLLPHVMEYNVPVALDRFVKVAELMGENVRGLNQFEAAMLSVKAVKRLIRDVKITATLRGLGVNEAQLPDMAEKTLEVGRLLRNNPRRLTAADIEGILRNAY
ncbi:iron-containing alcohol dehydrogenase [Paradesulfitobacterium ferrireducens]|uniref:iron-containing alcohol dehydrogenase n=1 Tax=Paradesulfitobacterium ferrireducens TaxID=2816476 RepID=UPI001A8E1547|nr:iron-containing alcohol dehydrogenase [Paradesulfitobacterium ferrireducens]